MKSKAAAIAGFLGIMVFGTIAFYCLVSEKKPQAYHLVSEGDPFWDIHLVPDKTPPLKDGTVVVSGRYQAGSTSSLREDGKVFGLVSKDGKFGLICPKDTKLPKITLSGKLKKLKDGRYEMTELQQQKVVDEE